MSYVWPTVRRRVPVKPASGTDRSTGFQMVNGVIIHGGFGPAAGRNWQVFAGSRSPGQTDPWYTE